jgi:hypothetical protein
MGVEINDRGMRSTTSGHTAQRLAAGGWVLSWLPGRVLTRNQAVSGLLLADTAGDGLEPGDSRWPSLDSWAQELGLSGPEAVVRVSTTDAVRERIAHGEVQERAEQLYRRHERCANEVRDALRAGDQEAVRVAQAELRRSQNELSSHLTAHRYEVSTAELPWLRYWQNPTYKQQRTELAGWHQIHDRAEPRAAEHDASSGSDAGAATAGDRADGGADDREFWSVDRDGDAFFDHEAVRYWAGAEPGWPGTDRSSRVWASLPVDEGVFQAAVEADQSSPVWRERVEQAAAAVGDRDPAVLEAWRQVCADETFADARDLYEARLVATHESFLDGGTVADDAADVQDIEDVVITCSDCELDFDDQHDADEASYLAGVHNDLHHAGRPTAVVVPVDVPIAEAAEDAGGEAPDPDEVQRARLAELVARAESARAAAVAMTGPVETSDAGQAWSERVDAAVFGMDAADPAELDRWMQRHAESSEPHVKEADLVAAWETHCATTDTSGQDWDGRLDEHERTATPDTADASEDVELSAADVGAD